MSRLPYVEELIRRLRLDGQPLDVEYGSHRTVRLTQAPEHRGHPVVVVVSEPDLEAAVTSIGTSCRDELWPSESVESAGFNLLLVHLDEVVATRDGSEPLLITADGLQWPGQRRPHCEQRG
ncbi:hypothetical protein [Modestobacter altitudinis]|uniref:hypothetical protein n=1 Tax=Modestobacter altitudinis TaxID=2213158 RepID=UPI00110CE64A|nr:hypothetical protein [Modestobacter altitudinis]